MRNTAAVIVLIVGCGRSGFEIDTNIIDVDRGESTVVVTAPDRFTLVFAREFNWQAVGWYDLTSDGTRDLVAGYDIEPSRHLLQGFLVRWGDVWLVEARAFDAAVTIEQPEPGRVRLSTSWTWTAPMRELSASVLHVIDRDGTWTIDATVSDPTGDQTPIQGVEYADAHVSQDVTWDVTGSGPSYTFAAQGVSPAPAIHVTRTSAVGMLQSDESNNRYWSVGSLPVPFKLSWTVSIWRP